MSRRWTDLVVRLSSLKESQRLRAVGSLVLILGIVGASLFYRAAMRSLDPTLDDALAPGYTRAQAREIGVLMGRTGVMMLGWQDTLARPDVEALIIAACSALLAAYFFRAAWVLDDDERVRIRQENDR